MKVKYIGQHEEVDNRFGKFKKDVEVEVVDEIGKMLVRSKKEFVNVEAVKPLVKEK